jgi:hypothetical protein
MTGYRVRAECLHCKIETNFWIQDNGKGMCPCSARRTWTKEELGVQKEEVVDGQN